MLPNGNAKQLAERTIALFAARPEVRKIVQFGSLVRGTADQYSDVDLEVITDHYACTIRDVNMLLKRIDEPLVIFPVREGTDQAAYTVLFRHYPFYQRLDIGIGSQDIATAADFSTRQIMVAAKDMQCAYIRSDGIAPPSDEMADGNPSLPGLGSSPNVRALYDTFIGATRYVKYRKRRCALTAYKFYRAILNDFLLNAHRHTWSETQKTSLGLMDYLALDGAGSDAFVRYLYPADEHVMNTWVIEMLSTLLFSSKADIDTHHWEALSTILQFIVQELVGKESDKWHT